MREAVKDVPYNVSTSFVNLAEGLSIDEARGIYTEIDESLFERGNGQSGIDLLPL